MKTKYELCDNLHFNKSHDECPWYNLCINKLIIKDVHEDNVGIILASIYKMFNSNVDYWSFVFDVETQKNIFVECIKPDPSIVEITIDINHRQEHATINKYTFIDNVIPVFTFTKSLKVRRHGTLITYEYANNGGYRVTYEHPTKLICPYCGSEISRKHEHDVYDIRGNKRPICGGPYEITAEIVLYGIEYCKDEVLDVTFDHSYFDKVWKHFE